MRGRSCAEPAFMVDTDAGALLGANPAGWTAWGLDPATAAPPLALDRRHAGPAAPARDRRDAGRRRRAAGDADVLDGPRAVAAHLPCRGVQGAGRRRCRQGAGARARSRRPAREAPAARRNRRGLDLDVALDAWLAHELRTPLSAVIAYAEILKNEHFGPLANPRYRSYARRHLRQRAACARRGRQHAARRSHAARPCRRWPSPTSTRPVSSRAA